MALRGTVEGVKVINFAKKHILRRLALMFFDKVHPIVEENDRLGAGPGWRRTSTPHIRKELLEMLEYWSLKPEKDKKPKTLLMMLDIFSLIYDTDDPYAEMFHRFVEICTQGRLHVFPGEKYLARGKTTDERREYIKKHGLEPDWYDVDRKSNGESRRKYSKELSEEFGLEE